MASQSDIDKLTAQISALDDAIIGGEKQTVINGESVTYRSIAELMAARADAQTRLNTMQAGANGSLRRPNRRTLLTFGGREYNDGLCNAYRRR